MSMSAVAEVVERTGQREPFFDEFLKDAPVPLAVVQKPGQVTGCNAMFERLPQCSSAHRPIQFVELLALPKRGEGQRLLAELFAGAREHFQIESQSMWRDNCVLRWTAWRVSGPHESAECALLMAEDLSEIAAAELRLRQAERLETIGRLAGGVAHDFNNVLTGVLLCCDLLIAALEPGHRGRIYAEEIRRAGVQASGLVQQLLSVARPTKLLPRAISLNETVDGMHNLLMRLVKENIELKIHLDPDLGLVKMDPTQAQQILLNLVLNARDALSAGGQIAVETGNCRVQVLSDNQADKTGTPTLPCALLTVTDNGHGMDESVRAHLFERFFTTKAGKGNGIGLATVHDIVSTNGGLIHVESKPGTGTRISVLLPLVPESVPEFLTPKSFHPVDDGSLLSFQAKDSTL